MLTNNTTSEPEKHEARSKHNTLTKHTKLHTSLTFRSTRTYMPLNHYLARVATFPSLLAMPIAFPPRTSPPNPSAFAPVIHHRLVSRTRHHCSYGGDMHDVCPTPAAPPPPPKHTHVTASDADATTVPPRTLAGYFWVRYRSLPVLLPALAARA